MKYEIGLAIVVVFGLAGSWLDRLVAQLTEHERIPLRDLREVTPKEMK